MGLLGPLLLVLFQHPVEDSGLCGRQRQRSCVPPVLPTAPVSLVPGNGLGSVRVQKLVVGVCERVLLLGSIMPGDHYAGLGEEVGVCVAEPKCWLHSCHAP